MLKQIRFLILTSLLIAGGSIYAGETNASKYAYDFESPSSIVDAACKMIMNSDYEEMINITEKAEKKRTIDTVEQMTNEIIRERVRKETKKILGYELKTIEYYTNNAADPKVVITAKWTIQVTGARPKNPDNYNRANKVMADPMKQDRNESSVYEDYLLKPFQGKWKIISTRSK
jgi:hypothetical protein